MSGRSVLGLIDQIDASVAENNTRIQSEVSHYIAENENEVVDQIVSKGYASIPTSAGDYTLTEKQLEEVAV